MKLSQIEKRIPQTLTNSKDTIQKGRETMRRSDRARLTRGQASEAWALYKSNPSRVFWGDLSRDRYISCPKLASRLLEIHLLKVCGIPFSIWESFIDFLACLFPVGVRISWKKVILHGTIRNDNF